MSQVPRCQVPLETGQEGVIRTTATIGHIFTVDSLCTWSHPDLVVTTIITHHGTRGVGAVTKPIPWVIGIGAGCIPPVVIIIIGGTGGWIYTPTIMSFNCGMSFIQTSIIPCHTVP